MQNIQSLYRRAAEAWRVERFLEFQAPAPNVWGMRSQKLLQMETVNRFSPIGAPCIAQRNCIRRKRGELSASNLDRDSQRCNGRSGLSPDVDHEYFKLVIALVGRSDQFKFKIGAAEEALSDRSGFRVRVSSADLRHRISSLQLAMSASRSFMHTFDRPAAIRAPIG